MREVVLAWPPTATASTVVTVRPSEAPYTLAASPAGPAPTTSRSQTPTWFGDTKMPSSAATSELDSYASISRF